MKANAARFDPPLQFVGKVPRITMVRSGRSGAAGELIDAGQQAAVDAFCQAELARPGSDFPYGRFFLPAA